VLKNNGAARFKPALGSALDLLDKTDYDTYLGALALSVTSPAGLNGTLATEASGGSIFATFAGEVAPYSSTHLVPAALLNQGTTGIYNISFRHKAQTNGLDPSLYPQGDGFARLTLKSAGTVSLMGMLADGVKYVASSRLRSDGTVPLFTPLYRTLGGMVGELAFANNANTDVAGADFLWLKPALNRGQYYRAGWPNGIRVDAVATAYATPDFTQGTASPTSGNSSLVFTGSPLSGPLTKPVSIDPVTGAVALIPSTNTGYKLSFVANKGLFSGNFKHTDGSTIPYYGIVLDKGANVGGFGFFLSTPPPRSRGFPGEVAFRRPSLAASGALRRQFAA
jgi:hypothetical protein